MLPIGPRADHRGSIAASAATTTTTTTTAAASSRSPSTLCSRGKRVGETRARNEQRLAESRLDRCADRLGRTYRDRGGGRGRAAERQFRRFSRARHRL